jgi:hypothetical protein
LNIERAQKSLVEDIRALVIGSKTNEVQIGTSPRDAYAAKRCVEVSSTIFTSTIQFVSAIQFFVGYSNFCQPFNFCDSHSIFMPAIFCLRHFCVGHFTCASHFVSEPFCGSICNNCQLQTPIDNKNIFQMQSPNHIITIDFTESTIQVLSTVSNSLPIAQPP